MTDSSIPTGDTGDSLQRELRHDLATARLQLTITQALCAYVEETNADERVRLIDVEFVHNGAKVSVKVRVGEAIAEVIARKDEAAIVDDFRVMQLLAEMGETCKASCQCGREATKQEYNGLEFLKGTTLSETLYDIAESTRINLENEINKLFFPGRVFTVTYYNAQHTDWTYEFRTMLFGNSEYASRGPSIQGHEGVYPGFVQHVARHVFEEFVMRNRNKDKVERGMYTTREDQERYGQGDGNVAAA